MLKVGLGVFMDKISNAHPVKCVTAITSYHDLAYHVESLFHVTNDEDLIFKIRRSTLRQDTLISLTSSMNILGIETSGALLEQDFYSGSHNFGTLL